MDPYTKDKGSADEKPEEYSEDETDLYDIIVNKPAETTDEKQVDAATETTDGTAGTGADNETDDRHDVYRITRLIECLMAYALVFSGAFGIAFLVFIPFLSCLLVDIAAIAFIILVIALFVETLVEPGEPDEHAHDDNVYSEDETDLSDLIIK